MANPPQAKKRIRRNANRAAINGALVSRIRTFIKAVETAIAAGKYVTRKLFVEVVTDGQGYSATRVEYQMTRWLSLLSTVSTIGRSSASVRVSKDY